MIPLGHFTPVLDKPGISLVAALASLGILVYVCRDGRHVIYNTNSMKTCNTTSCDFTPGDFQYILFCIILSWCSKHKKGHVNFTRIFVTSLKTPVELPQISHSIVKFHGGFKATPLALWFCEQEWLTNLPKKNFGGNYPCIWSTWCVYLVWYTL